MKTKSLLVVLSIILTSFLLSCTIGINNFSSVEGSGKVIKEIRSVKSFNSIKAGSAFEIIVTKGDVQSMCIETDDNIMDLIESRVYDGELKLSLEENINNPTKMTVNITIPELKNIDLSGACDLVSESRFDNKNMEIELSGASDVELKVKCNFIDIDMSGASELNISGFAAEQNIEASGASKLRAYNLESDIVAVDCSGSSSVKVYARESITGSASGASNVYYKGNPSRVMVDESGAASFSRN